MRRRPGNPRVAVALLRVSTDRQELGPQAQREAIEAWAAREGVEVPEWFQEVASGGADPVHRPVMADALDAVERLRAGFLVIHERSRLARDVDLAGYFRTMAKMRGAEVVATDGEGNRLADGVKDLLSEMERIEIGKRTKRALAVLKRAGLRTGSDPEYGFRVSEDGFHVEEEPEERAAVALMLSLRRDGKSYPEICRLLLEAGYKPRPAKANLPEGWSASGAWQPMTVWRIVKREAKRATAT